MLTSNAAKGDSVEAAQFAASRKNPVAALWPRFDRWLVLLLVVWLYLGVGGEHFFRDSISYRLVVQWATPDFSHGFLVPAFSFFVLWQNRDRLKNVRTAPSWTGLPLVILALVMILLGVLGVELFTSRVSLLVLLAGLIILFGGWPLFRAVLFPWAFLFLMIPLPSIILQQFTFPLQLFASQVSAWALWNIFNIPCHLEGNQITLPHITLQVGDACSGIRSLMSLTTLAIIYGYLMETRQWVRVTLAFTAVPIAIIANIFRIVITGMLGKWNSALAEGFYHEFQGWLVFVVALLMFFATHRLINWIWKPAPVGNLPAHQNVHSEAPATRARGSSARFATAAAAALMLATAIFLQAHSRGEILPARQPLSALPQELGVWTGTDDPLDDGTLKTLGHGEFLNRIYVNASNQEPGIGLFVAYYPTQKFGDTIHTPLHCLVGAGYTPVRRELVQLTGPLGVVTVNRWVAAKGLERNLVLYWFQAHGRVVASEYSAKYYLVSDSIRLHRSDGSLIRLLSPMYPDESPDAAQARIMKLGSQFLPLLDNSIPR